MTPWRAGQVAEHLSPAADELVPRLSRRFAEIDFLKQWSDMISGALVSALAALRDPAGLPALTHTVSAGGPR